MDFVQSMGLSRVTRNILNNAISGSSIGKIAAVTNSKLEKELDYPLIKNNLGIPILIKVLGLDQDYDIIKREKTKEIKKNKEYRIKYVIPQIEPNDKEYTHFETGRKVCINMNINSKEIYELSKYMDDIKSDDLEFYELQKKQLKKLEKTRSSRSRSSSSQLNTVDF